MGWKKLQAPQLYTTTDVAEIERVIDQSSAELDIIGQSRALQAIEFGIGMQSDNYHLYLAGSKGLGKYEIMQNVLREHVDKEPTPADWCYVDNYEEFYRPKALRLPAGMGLQLREDMAQLVDDLLVAVPAAYESDEYRTRVQEIEGELEERREKAFADLSDEADSQGITMINSPAGYTLVPLSKGKPMQQEEFKQLDESTQKELEQKIDVLKEKLKDLILQVPLWEKETRDKFKELNTAFAKSAVKPFLKSLIDKYSSIPEIKAHLDIVSKDIVANVQFFFPQNPRQNLLEGQTTPISVELRRYEVNVLVNNANLEGVPIVYENNPTYNNLIGRIEHISQDGALITDFTLIKPGALHHANGGYLILDMQKLLINPFAWDGLKRTLYARKIRMESVDRMYSLVSTVTLEPETIPLNVKVILVGDRYLYFLLKTYDPEFNELFKVTADFSESFDRNAESTLQLAKTIRAMASREEVRPISSKGIARIIEQCSRDTGDAEKLSLHGGQLKDLILESDYWAGKLGHSEIESEHVQKAIDTRIHRADQIQEQIQEQILRDIVLIDTEGSCVGQINGLSVYRLGDYSFGQPSRITATARLGTGNVMDIEREIKMGGPIHSKGVMILSSCLANRYACNRPLSLSATLVFEQNYGGVDGDSASIAEFTALVSAIANIPIKQSMAVTGSINQHGKAQAIGGVNEKIEGFFDICKARGLTAENGVLIPSANAKHLMLRQDVVDAVSNEQFHIYTVEDINDALELLMGAEAGIADEKGNYPQGSINHKVVSRLDELQQLRSKYAISDASKENKDEE